MSSNLRKFTMASVLAAGLPAFAVGLGVASILGAAAAFGESKPGPGDDGTVKAKPAAKNAGQKIDGLRLYFPKMDSAKGMVLFASKGCVACHAINGVGGHDHTALDAHTMAKRMNPFEFAAKMWRGAPAMIQIQEEVFGEQITFTGDDLAHIIAFVHDDKQQHKFTEAMIPPKIRKLMKHSHGAKPAHGKELGHDKMMKKRK